MGTDVAHIRAGQDETIGYVDNYTIWPPDNDITHYNIDSLDRKINKEESFIMINNLGKILGVRLLSAENKGRVFCKKKVHKIAMKKYISLPAKFI